MQSELADPGAAIDPDVMPLASDQQEQTTSAIHGDPSPPKKKQKAAGTLYRSLLLHSCDLEIKEIVGAIHVHCTWNPRGYFYK